MLTVKVVEELNKTETIYEATNVRKSLKPGFKKDDPVIGEVHVDCAEGGTITYSICPDAGPDEQRRPEAWLYVMNRHGATVGSYQL